MQKTLDEDLTMEAMQSAYQAGIVARATSQIIACNTLDELITCANKTLNELGCAGFARFLFNRETRHIKFGNSLRLQRRPAATNAAQGSINNNEENAHFTYSTHYILLIVDVENCNVRDGNRLKENVAIYADSLNTWLKCREEIQCERIESISETMSVINNLENFTLCLHRINDRLLNTQRSDKEELWVQLMAAFTELGLHSEQKSTILKVVNAAIERESKMLGLQIKQNIELRVLIESAVKLLLPKEDKEISHAYRSGSALN